MPAFNDIPIHNIIDVGAKYKHM